MLTSWSRGLTKGACPAGTSTEQRDVEMSKFVQRSGLHLAIDASNIRLGGGLTHISRVLHEVDPLQSGIHQVTVWAGKALASILPERSWLNLCCESWMDASLPERMFGRQFLLPKEIGAAQCDVLFSPSGTLPNKCNLPNVIMSQNLLPFDSAEALRFGPISPMRWKIRMLRHFQGNSLRRADGIIFLTSYARDVVSHDLGGISGEKVLIPHGIEKRFMQLPRPQREITRCSFADPFRLLYVSSLMPYKHQIEVATAAYRLRASGVPIEMRFVGAPWGEYGRKFKKVLYRLDPKGEYLIWSGCEPFETMHNKYGNADAIVFASSCESLPNILIEAMASSLPIACSDRGPMPDVLGDAGVYFDPCSPDSIAETVRKLAFDSTLRTILAERAWQRAQKYSWEKCANDTFNFIIKIARRSRH